jgi:hypothetical protein
MSAFLNVEWPVCLEALARSFPEALSGTQKHPDNLPSALQSSYLGSSLVNAIGSQRSSFPSSYYLVIVRSFAVAWMHAVIEAPSNAEIRGWVSKPQPREKQLLRGLDDSLIPGTAAQISGKRFRHSGSAEPRS